MKIAMIGSGYVGLVSAACFANIGNRVYCLERDAGRLAALQRGQAPIYEPGLEALMADNVGTLSFHSAPEELGQVLAEVELAFIAVGTPMLEGEQNAEGAGGASDLSAVYAVAREIGRAMQKPLVIVGKSTVPVGTGERVRQLVAEELARRGQDIPFSVVSNPEFLKEGKAIADFSSPDRVVLGGDDPSALDVLTELYRPLVWRNPKERILRMSLRSAELTKYAANAMLAARISFINEIAELCEAVGADIHEVREGLGSDQRIGSSFLYPGAGYGGSCFPKDIQALRCTFAQHQLPAPLLEAIEVRNARQKHWAFEKITAHYSSTQLHNKRFALWGLSFKPDTDDVRQAPSLVLIEQLLRSGASICAYCPKGHKQTKQYFQPDATGESPRPHLNGQQLGRLHYADSAYEAATGADALVLLTEWREFLSPDWQRLKALLKKPLLFDARTQFTVQHLAGLGFRYYAVGLRS